MNVGHTLISRNGTVLAPTYLEAQNGNQGVTHLCLEKPSVLPEL